jgi:hypothetical protein
VQGPRLAQGVVAEAEAVAHTGAAGDDALREQLLPGDRDGSAVHHQAADRRVPGLVEERVTVEEQVIIVVVEAEMGGESERLHEQVGAGALVGGELRPHGGGASGEEQRVRRHPVGPAADAALGLGLVRAAVGVGLRCDEEKPEFLGEVGGQRLAVHESVGGLEGGHGRDLKREGLAHFAGALQVHELPTRGPRAHGERDEVGRQGGQGGPRQRCADREGETKQG